MTYCRWWSNQDQSGATAGARQSYIERIADRSSGKQGYADAEPRAGFQQAIANLGNVGFTIHSDQLTPQ
jgi:hypothetical protein